MLTRRVALAALVPLIVAGTATVEHHDVSWMGHRWTVTNGPMAGVAPGSPTNVTIDSHGHLHLRIEADGSSSTAAELFSTDKLGFGTYQWQLQGAVDTMAAPTVLGLFPYGPQAGVGVDGEDELDIEFSTWNHTLCGGRCNADFTFYPDTGHRTLGPTEHDFLVSLHGARLTTARLIWTSRRVTAIVMAGLQPVTSTAQVLHRWSFAPTDFLARVPQHPVPVGMNLWCSERCPTSDQAVVIRSFTFLSAPGAPRGTPRAVASQRIAGAARFFHGMP